MKHKGAYSTGVQRGGSDGWMSPCEVAQKNTNLTRCVYRILEG